MLHIRWTPGLIDVNVHPSEMEVKFSKERELLTFVESAIADALGKHTLIPEARTAVKRQAVIQEQLEWPRPDLIRNQTVDRKADPAEQTADTDRTARTARTAHAVRTPHTANRTVDRSENTSRVRQERKPSAAEMKEAVRRYMPEVDGAEPGGKAAAPSEEQKPRSEHRFPYLYPIGQMRGTYIIAQNEDGLY